MLIVKAFQELLQRSTVCIFAGESQTFYWLEGKKKKKKTSDGFEKNPKVPS